MSGIGMLAALVGLMAVANDEPRRRRRSRNTPTFLQEKNMRNRRKDQEDGN